MSAQLTASRSGDQTGGSGAKARDSERPVSRVDEELRRLLDWDTPLPGLA